MSYSNGKLPEDTISHDKIIEIVKGLPGVGFKLTDDGDYDIQNKKLRNVNSPQANTDATTKSYVDSEVSKTLKLDGSSVMVGLLDMGNSRIQNVAPGRHGTTDVLTHLQLEAFYADLNTNTGNIEIQNPIDMKNQNIMNLADGTLQNDAVNKKQLDSKANSSSLGDYLKKDGSVGLTANWDVNDKKIIDVADPVDSKDCVNLRYLDHYLKRDGSLSMTDDLDLDGADILMANGKIKGLSDPVDNTDAVNKQYLESHTTNLRLGDYLKRDGTQEMTGDLDMSNKKIKNLADPTGVNDAQEKVTLIDYFWMHFD